MTVHVMLAALVVTLLLEIVELSECIIGWVWGCLTNIIYMLVLGVWVYKSAKKSTEAAVRATKSGVFVRLIIVAIATLLADLLFLEFHYISYIAGIFVWRPFAFYEHIRSRLLEEKMGISKVH